MVECPSPRPVCVSKGCCFVGIRSLPSTGHGIQQARFRELAVSGSSGWAWIFHLILQLVRQANRLRPPNASGGSLMQIVRKAAGGTAEVTRLLLDGQAGGEIRLSGVNADAEEQVAVIVSAVTREAGYVLGFGWWVLGRGDGCGQGTGVGWSRINIEMSMGL